MSTHQCSLGKLARRGASLQITQLAATMRSLYHTRSRPCVAQSMGQLCQRSKPAAQPCNFERGRVRKIAGVKKTVANQMQGMGPSLGHAKVAPYKIYGKTRLFSSASSLNSRLQHLAQEEDGEEYSVQEAQPPHTTASLSATQRRYNQAAGLGKGMAMQTAKDISQSIQEELMVVDADTRDMLNCDPSRKALRDYHDQMAQRSKNSVDPMQGWKHPKNLKYLSNLPAESSASSPAAQPEEEAQRQVRPRRRQMVMGHAIRNLDAISNPPLQLGSGPGPRFEMYTSNAKEMFSEQRSELRPQTSWHSPKPAAEDSSEDQLMDVSMVRPERPDITVARATWKPVQDAPESDSWYEQPKAEREFLKQTFLGGAKSRRKMGQSQLDELHYEATDNAAQISASQQVINQKYAGFRKSARGNQKQIIESVNPTPQLKPHQRAMSEPRDTRRRRGTAKQGVERQAAPRFFGGNRKPAAEDQDDEEDSRESNWPSPSNSLLPTSSRSDPRLQTESRTRGRSVMGEKRGPKKSPAAEAAVEHDEIAMPPGYKKQSAVQRLGSASSKYNSRAFNSY
ncbi:uncharacterized protein LOC6552385 [Drosophila erecta]|uniref:GG11100 n=1 Tax=Drosophila erecta TaxID=7220 RepID=B3P2B1_DROER|nr:uncharacterized protein LOC6552385 [Drosophila erecta]EDV47861.1 uncharacterized protein Dere_GG11100 [Drosophila erecta]